MSEFDKEVETRMSKRLDLFTDEFSPPGASQAFPGADFNKRAAPYQKSHDDFSPETNPQFWDKSIDRSLHSAGDPADQEKMDWLDEQVHKIESPIKNPYDQFPGTIDMEDHKAIAKYDVHQTDPRRLSASANKYQASNGKQFHYFQDPATRKFEIYDEKGRLIAFSIPTEEQAKRKIEQIAHMEEKKNMSQKIDGPDAFHKEVEKRMKHLNVKKPGDKTEVEENPKPTKEPKWNSGKNPDEQMSKGK